MAEDGNAFAYLFEAKGIQRYIFDSGSLRDLVGASDLVAGLAQSSFTSEEDCEPAGDRVDRVDQDVIGAVLAALAAGEADSESAFNKHSRIPDGNVAFSRRAGGSFVLHATDRELLLRVRALWRLVAGLRCPGLEMSDALFQASGAPDHGAALAAVYDEGSAVRFNSAAELPPTGGPYTEFNQRTGRLATRIFAYRDNDLAVVDHVTEAHRARAEVIRTNNGGMNDGVALRYLPPGKQANADGVRFAFPRNLEPATDRERDEYHNPAFPFNGSDHRIAIVHADLSGLGELFRAVTARGDPGLTFRTAREIEVSVQRAAQKALDQLILPAARVAGYGDPKQPDRLAILPARPVVLGGDDITIMVRADLAVPFANALLRNIEEETKGVVGRSHLSACAGIAIVKAGQPFQMAYALAESLCKFAKKTAKNLAEQPYPSMLAFHNAQSTLQEEYGDIRRREKPGIKLPRPGPDASLSELWLTANPYRVGDQATTGHAWFNHLDELSAALNIEPRGLGKLIELRNLLSEDEAGARRIWKRWLDVLKSRNQTALDRCRDALGKFGIECSEQSLPVTGTCPALCPIPDALELIDLTRSGRNLQ